MINFPELLKKIRQKSGLTQEQMAKALKVSKVLVAMIETGQKPVSKKIVIGLAEALDVSPFSLMPTFFFDESEDNKTKRSAIEKKLLLVAGKLQEELINKRAKKLKDYVDSQH